MNDRITALEEALEFYADQSAWTQPPVKTRDGILSVEYENQASKMQRDRGDIARAALAASRAAPDCHQPDLVTAAQHRSFPEAGDGRPMPPMGDDLMTAGLNADDARFVAVQLAQNGLMLVPVAALDLTPAPAVEPRTVIGGDASVAVCQICDIAGCKHVRGEAPVVEPVADNSPQRAVSEIGNQIHNIACELHGNEDVQERLGALASEAWRISATLSQAPPAPTAHDAARVPEIAALIEAVNGLGLRALVAGWNGEGRDRPYTPHKSELGATIKTTCGTVYAIDAALRAIGGDV